MRSVFDGILAAKAVAPVAVNGTGGTPVAQAVFVVDTFGYNSGMFEINVGTPTGTTVTYTIAAQVTECATSGGTYTNIASAVGTITGFGTALAEDCQIRVEGLGTSRLRYLKLVLVCTTAPTDKVVLVSANALLGRAFKNPQANSATGTAAA